ncbi:hypothetical protein D0865_05569 [Hortaea werneckii]|uniref:PLD phosphodiesterase domain-containing protein n=1 Tax=Hortaea werneckii TaxID=91943 RepID=A0A3M7CL69_HORWE|nr:hypothetical protein D0865_05569 [Hortaea werneckii]
MDATELTKAISSRLSNEDASQRAQNDSPSYWTSDAETLRSSSNIGDISFGTGHSIYSSKISPIIEQACHEVVLVTCFWAQSETSSVLNDSLRKLAAKATEMGKLIRRFPAVSPLAVRRMDANGVPSVFLPSPHHWNPQIRMPWQRSPKPPPTPLNICLLGLFAKASDNVFIQTPNITAQPVLDALLAALSRGVNIRIVTSERLMVLEQLVTAGTTNKRCVQWLISQHRQLLNRHRSASASPGELESGMIGEDAGTLRIEYYRPRAGEGRAPSEPVQSHLKLTIVDDRIAVHGSGNMDRASWYTSQELGVAFISSELVSSIKGGLAEAMQGRSEILYDSSGQH